jgi:hypothetical protein
MCASSTPPLHCLRSNLFAHPIRCLGLMEKRPECLVMARKRRHWNCSLVLDLQIRGVPEQKPPTAGKDLLRMVHLDGGLGGGCRVCTGSANVNGHLWAMLFQNPIEGLNVRLRKSPTLEC